MFWASDITMFHKFFATLLTVVDIMDEKVIEPGESYHQSYDFNECLKYPFSILLYRNSLLGAE